MSEQKTREELDAMYLSQINELKEKMDGMVDPEEYDRLAKQHKTLLDDFVNKRPSTPVPDESKKESASDLAKKLANYTGGNVSNRDYIETSVNYREAMIRETGLDPWTDFGAKGPGRPTEDTTQLAAIFQQLLDENEDPVSFRIKLNNILEDDNVLLSKIRSRKQEDLKYGIIQWFIENE